MNETTHVDMIVRCNNPKALDGCVQTYGAVVSEAEGIAGNYWKDENGDYLVRCFKPKNADFLAFVIEHQGYGKVVKTL